MTTPAKLAKQLCAILDADRDRILLRIDAYMRGEHDDPYMPETATDEYRLLARRSVTNVCPLLVATPAQALYVDDFRAGMDRREDEPLEGRQIELSPEMKHWQRSGLDARQGPVYRGALTFGHSFVVTQKRKGEVRSKGLSALRTSAVFEDPANDADPYAALTVTKWPRGEEKGEGVLWDAKYEYPVTFKKLSDAKSIRVGKGVRHGASSCPVTRFAAAVDLDGRTVGVVEPMIPLNNRINQTVFDLLLAQTYGSTKVRYVTGMAPPVMRDRETGEPLIDETGNPQPIKMNHNASRFLFAEDPDVRFGSLDETPLDGYINSIEMSFQHMSSLGQVPPHHLLGKIANLSAEALLAAETSLARKIEEFRKAFGESWERVFRIAMELEGNLEAAEDYAGEAIWRDMEQRSLAQSADALGKLAESLDIPKRGLWARIPGATSGELREWDRLYDDELERDPRLGLTESLVRSGAGSLVLPDDGGVAG